MKNAHDDDIVKHIFDDKYTRKQIITSLAILERNKPRFVELMKKYHKNYVLPDDTVASFLLLMDLNKAHGKDKYCQGLD